jgi:hypothetical protein
VSRDDYFDAPDEPCGDDDLGLTPPPGAFIPHEDLSPPPRVPDFSERKGFGPQTVGGPPPITQSALFSAAKHVSREHVVTTFPTMFGPPIKYRGPRLTRFHWRVLLGLMTEAAGMKTETKYGVSPRSFAVNVLGRSSNKHSRDLVVEAMKDLRSAAVFFPVWNEFRGVRGGWDRHSVNLLTHYSEEGHLIAFSLDRNIIYWFEGPQFRVSMIELRQLNDGLETWLYGLVRSYHCKKPISLETLRKMSGYEREPKYFNRDVRAAMAKLKRIGQVTSVTFDDDAKTLTCKPVWVRSEHGKEAA